MNNSLSILLIYSNYIFDRLYLLIKRKFQRTNLKTIIFMKTIQFRTQDQTIWTINVKQITTIFQTSDNRGTYIRLSCGKELFTLLSPKQVLDDIKEQLKN